LSVFLTPDELRELTGRSRPKAQATFLRARHIRHVVNRAGRVVIMREWLAGEQRKEPSGPNFAALKALA
jgi:hypothetical protein